MKIPASNINVATFSGLITVKKDIHGDMEFVIESNRCSFDMKICEKYPGAHIRELCKIFNTKNAFYSSIFDNIEPPIKCPLKAGNYTIDETKLDLSALAVLPVDGYVWVSTLKILSEAGNKKKRIVMCINTETKIIRTNIRSILKS